MLEVLVSPISGKDLPETMGEGTACIQEYYFINIDNTEVLIFVELLSL